MVLAGGEHYGENVQFAQAKLARVDVAGSVVGAVVGGTLATVYHGTSGVAFWAGLCVGVIVGPVCLTAAFALFEFALAVRRRTSHRS